MLVDLREPKDAPAAQRLEMYWPLIRAAVWRWADPGRWDHEDLVQEAALAVWLVLRDRPDVSVSFMRVVADHAARDSLIRGRSVDRVLVGGKKKGGRIQNPWSLVSMDALQEDPMRWRTFESRLVGMARRSGGDLPSPTEDLAVAQILYKELWDTLTPRQRSVLDLRLAGYTQADVARRLRSARTVCTSSSRRSRVGRKVSGRNRRCASASCAGPCFVELLALAACIAPMPAASGLIGRGRGVSC